MSTEFTPYINREPGDLVSASDWNSMQVEIKKDISDKIKDAIGEIKSVAHADDADRLENKTAKELSDEIVNTALQQAAKQTGYRLYFKLLEPGQTSVIEHNLKMFPQVDLCLLDPFPVVLTEDGDEKVQSQAYFFLYNADLEQRLRATPGGASVEIEKNSEGERQFKIPWSELLALYNVDYDDQSSIANLEGEFWGTLFSKPNDRFDDDDYAHSPYFSLCCGQERTVGQIKSKREFDDLYLKMMPRKTVNFTGQAGVTVAPSNIEIVHYDFNRLGLTFYGRSELTREAGPAGPLVNGTAVERTAQTREARGLVILKV